MNAISPICLTDLAPALRWSRPEDLTPYLGHSRLVDGWWRSLPLPRALDIAGPPWLAHNLALLMSEYWDHVPVGDFLPVLRALPVDLDEVAEPVRGALLATAGDWATLIGAPPSAVADWPFPADCGPVEVIGSAAWQALRPFCGEEARTGPLPSPALMIEAVRTVAHWLPESAPDRVRRALGYLSAATGADLEEGPPPEAVTSPPQGRADVPQSAATRAIRTLRALRNQHAREQEQGEGQGHDHGAERPGGHGGDGSELGAHPMVDLLEEFLRGWSPLERTVAAERLFAADPISIRLLADQIGADIGDIRNAQRSVEERLLQWLSSSGGEPVTRHLRELSEELGAATTIDTLIGAHPDHPVTVPSLKAPLWRVLITFFTDRRLHNGWLVADDPERMRWQTREMLGDAPTLDDAAVRLDRIGIRRRSLRAWLQSTPGIDIRDGRVLIDPSLPPEGPAPAPAFGGRSELSEEDGSTTAGGLPIRRRPGAAHEAGAPRPEAAGAPAAAPPPPGVATSPRCFRAPDGRWWHRVDIGPEHLNGAPVTVPPGYATHLGLQPGRLLCLTAPGADLLVLVWRDEAAFDSLRPLLRRLSAQPGDRVFITVEGDRLDARRLPAADLGGHGPTGRALHLIGYTAPAPTDEALRIIARRITEEENPEPDPRKLLEMLSQRGDEDIAEELRQSLATPH
ncbi:hypothetical protein O4J56_13595 [Nocardiopsis sp. RSe5-2]|uniref:Uncharacterized protein n=1 Tax=Nocardiopsis endophytica TaxID=3018445 RepID=A0ABT4U5A8_9ACTN|nr:hypothetical protein [Nocardiopsis endophytica]MDA2811669.1 hypothetical protein [Nocardiopsis endophytica]